MAGNVNVWVVRSRAIKNHRIARSKVYLRERDAIARARKWADLGYCVTLETSTAVWVPVDFGCLFFLFLSQATYCRECPFSFLGSEGT